MRLIEADHVPRLGRKRILLRHEYAIGGYDDISRLRRFNGSTLILLAIEVDWVK